MTFMFSQRHAIKKWSTQKVRRNPSIDNKNIDCFLFIYLFIYLSIFYLFIHLENVVICINLYNL